MHIFSWEGYLRKSWKPKCPQTSKVISKYIVHEIKNKCTLGCGLNLHWPANHGLQPRSLFPTAASTSVKYSLVLPSYYGLHPSSPPIFMNPKSQFSSKLISELPVLLLKPFNTNTIPSPHQKHIRSPSRMLVIFQCFSWVHPWLVQLTFHFIYSVLTPHHVQHSSNKHPPEHNHPNNVIFCVHA